MPAVSESVPTAHEAAGTAGNGGLLGAATDVVSLPTEAQLRAARAAGELVDAYRLHGHRAARLDPLGSKPPGHPQLDPEFHGITWDELASVPASMQTFGYSEASSARAR